MKVNKVFIILLISILIASLSGVSAANETDVEDDGEISVEPVIADDTPQNNNTLSIGASNETVSADVTGIVSGNPSFSNVAFSGNTAESGGDYSNTLTLSVYTKEDSDSFYDENVGVSLTYDDYVVEVSTDSFITISLSNNNFKTTPNISADTTRRLGGITLFSAMSDNFLVLDFDFLNESSNDTSQDGFMVAKNIFFGLIDGISNLFKSAQKLLFSFIA